MGDPLPVDFPVPVATDGTEEEEIKLVPEVVAPVSLTFKFHNLCDFQYLPAVRKKVSRRDNLEFGNLTDFRT